MKQTHISQAKQELRVAGITALREDSGFLVVGVVFRGNRELDGVMVNQGEARLPDLINEMLKGSRHRGQIRLLILDDLQTPVDIQEVWEKTMKPVLMRIKDASFDPRHMFKIGDQVIWAAGIDEESARRVLNVIMDENGCEALRIADMILRSIAFLHNV